MDINNLCPGCMNEIVKGEKCPFCGYQNEPNEEYALPIKSILAGRYMIGKLLFSSCESLVYMAYDVNEEKAVNIKEYFPEDIAERAEDGEVFCREESIDAFNAGAKEFFELNKKLTTLDLPALSKTHSVFEENGTVYSVYTAIVGVTLKDFLIKNDGRLKWEQARPLLLPLIDTVIGLNKAGIIHGGISPESILVSRDGRVRLGEILINSVREYNDKLTSQIYGGYAAIEQYDKERFNMGEFTDVYAVSATFYRVLMGVVPAEAVDRIKNDTLSVPSEIAGELPRQVLVAIANGLQVMPENRTENMEIFKDELVYGETFEVETETKVKKKDKKEKNKPAKEEKKERKSGVKVGLITALVTVLILGICAAVLVFGPFKDKVFGSKDDIDMNSDEMPSTASIGDYDSSAVNAAPKYAVPNLLGQTFAEIKANDEYSRFNIEFDKKVYSNIHRKGTVCEQSVNPGTEVEAGSTIKITISLGPEEFQMPDVSELSELGAKVQLLRAGILYDNIEVVAKNDSEKKSGVVIDQSPSSGETITEDTTVRIYVNTYTEESE
ncbi:MAG: PASTA domain-containing protein [Clostridia bacterium]|nr:PASTA domain-containing protein [Clostridia bacterium]